MSLDYNESHIQELDFRDAVRLRSGMYLNSSGKQALFKIDMEIIQNVIDEFTAGRCNGVKITHDSHTGYTRVEDESVGIPIGKILSILTKSHSGGKFDNKAYSYSIGSNGLGLALSNFMSKSFIIQVWQKSYKDNHGNIIPNRHARLEFEQGLLISETYDNSKNPDGRHGTTLEYILDEEVLGDTKRDISKMKQALEMIMFINPGFRIEYTLDNKTQIYDDSSYLNGYIQHFMREHKIKSIMEPQIFEIENEENGIGLKVSFTYSPANKGDSSILSFVNGNNTATHGTHVTGVRSGLSSALTNYIARNNSIPKNLSDLKITGSTISDNIVAIVITMHPDPNYNTQSKEKLTSAEVEPIAKQAAYNFFTNYLNTNTGQANKLIELAISYAKFEAESKKLKKDMVIVKDNKNAFSSNGIDPGKFTNCKSNDPTKRELFIVEGRSAGGSLNNAINQHTQAIYRLRGKLTNVYNNKNFSREILDLISIQGVGHPDKKNINNLKFNKIILLCDADDDGGHIVTLVLAFYHMFYPELIERGHIYIAKPPIKMIKTSKTRFFATTEQDYDTIIEKLILSTFNFYSSKTNKQLSDNLFKVFIKKTVGYSELLDNLSIPLCIEPELLEFIVVHIEDLMNEKYDVFNKNNYMVNKRVINGINTFDFDIGYKHMFLTLDTDFYDNVYLPIITKLQDIHLYGVYIEGKNSGEKYYGSIYTIHKIMNSVLGNKVEIKRFKGLGEMNADQLEETAINPETRNILKVTMNDTAKAAKAAGVFMGSLDPDLKKQAFSGVDIFKDD